MTAMDTGEILEGVETTAARIRELLEQRRMVEAEIADCERRLDDINHRIERPDCKCRERNRLATQLAAIRRERRALKDWLKVNQPYFEYIGSGDGERIQKMLGNLIGVGRRVEKSKAARVKKQEG